MPDRGGHLRPTSTRGLPTSTSSHLETTSCIVHYTSPKMWQEHLNATLRDMQLHQLKSDRCVWVKKNIIVLAYVDDLLIAGTSRDTTLFSGATSTILQPQTLYSSYISTTTSLLGKAHLQTSEWRHHSQSGKVLLLQHVEEHGPRRQQQSYIYTISAQTSSTTRFTTGSRSTSHLPQSCWNAHLGIPGTSRPPVYSEGPHSTSVISDRMGLDTSEAHTQVHQGTTMHYKFLISPRLPQGHSLPLRQLIPLQHQHLL